VKLAEFKALCDREWAKDRHGDVQALHLTDRSLLEFSTEILLAGAEDQPFLFPLIPLVGTEDIPGIRAGKVFSKVLNPITRSVVSISGGSDQDLAEVYSAPDGLTEVAIPPDPAVKLADLSSLARCQRKNAEDLREAITAARDAGATWAQIGQALDMPRETAFRQHRAGSPIVVVKAYQSKPRP